MRGDTRVVRVVAPHVEVYRSRYMPIFRDRVSYYNNHYSRWGGYYHPWHRHGFYGGWYWRLSPVYEIHDHFWNPIVFWLWCDSWDDYYYNRWYGSDWWSYPDLRRHFPAPGVFYPTVAMRDLALGISLMTPLEQGNFRIGLIDLVSQLQRILSERAGFQVAFGRNDIVVTHYQMLESAVVLDGFVGSEAGQYPFKALLDLNTPSQNVVFVPGMGEGEPSDGQLLQLRELNERVERLGGTNEFPPEGQLPPDEGRQGDLEP